MDKKSNIELLEYILSSILLIQERSKIIKSSDDFLKDNIGIEKLDSISMRLQAIGEAIKNINKRDSEFLNKFASSEYWSIIIKMREVISHHYIDINSEIVFDIVKNELDELKIKIEKILKALNE